MTIDWKDKNKAIPPSYRLLLFRLDNEYGKIRICSGRLKDGRLLEVDRYGDEFPVEDLTHWALVNEPVEFI